MPRCRTGCASARKPPAWRIVTTSSRSPTSSRRTRSGCEPAVRELKRKARGLVRGLRVLRLARASLHFVRHDIGRAVFAAEQLVGVEVADELLDARVHVQRQAERELGGVDVHIVGLEVLGHAAKGFLHAFHRLDLFLDHLGLGLLAESVGDVASVAERAGKMAFPDFGVQVGALPALHGGNEIVEVGAALLAALQLLDLVAVLVEERRAGVVGNRDVTVFALDDDADARAAVNVHALGFAFLFLLVAAVGTSRFRFDGLRRQTAHLEDQRCLDVLMINDLRVGRLSVVLVADPAADTDHARRKLVHAEEPARDVHLVDALIAEVAIAVVPEPMPVVVELAAAQFVLRRGTAPDVVINCLGHRLRAFGQADGVAALVAQSATDDDLAELALLHQLHRFGDVAAAAALRASLHDAVVLARGLDNFAAFPNVVRHGLLDVHVLARLDRPDGRQRMPMVGRGDRDCVDLRFLEHLAHVAETFSGFLVLFRVGQAAVEDLLIYVAIGDDSYALSAELAVAADVRVAAAIEADYADADRVVGA